MEKLKTVEIIKKLRSNVAQIRNLFNEKIPRWLSNESKYDKTRWGFKEGDDNGWRTPITVCFHAWCGTYGDSSTYNQIDLNQEVFSKHFISYLNRNQKEIMLAIADSIMDEIAINFVREENTDLVTHSDGSVSPPSKSIHVSDNGSGWYRFTPESNFNRIIS